MSEKLSSLSRQVLVRKLQQIRHETTLPLYPPKDPDAFDYIAGEIYAVIDRLKLLFDRFELSEGRLEVSKILRRAKGNVLWIVEEPPHRHGELGTVSCLNQLIDDFLFVYSDADVPAEQPSLQYQHVVRVLRGIERFFTKTPFYPANEGEFHAIAEAVLICSFPRLVTKPALTTPIKNFLPDTGIPEARTLIEYKYISSQGQVSARVDEVFADLAGYRDRNWERLVYVFYETQRFVSEEKWAEQLKGFRGTKAIVIKGIPAAPVKAGDPTQ
jgi:hypothetical protein